MASAKEFYKTTGFPDYKGDKRKTTNFTYEDLISFAEAFHKKESFKALARGETFS